MRGGRSTHLIRNMFGGGLQPKEPKGSKVRSAWLEETRKDKPRPEPLQPSGASLEVTGTGTTHEGALQQRCSATPKLAKVAPAPVRSNTLSETESNVGFDRAHRPLLSDGSQPGRPPYQFDPHTSATTPPLPLSSALQQGDRCSTRAGQDLGSSPFLLACTQNVESHVQATWGG